MNESTFLGRPRWQVTLAIVFFAQMLTTIGFSLVFPFLPLYVEHLGSTTGLSVEWLAGLVIGVQGFTMMFASPLWGAIADRYGRKMMVLRSMYGGTIIMAMMGLVTTSEQLIVLRAIQGLITGTVAANNALVASAVPRNRVGFAMGTLQIGLWGGVAVGPLLGGILADMYGFAVPFFVTAVALFVGGLLIQFGIHEDFVPQKQKNDKATPSIFEQWQHVFSANGISMLYVTQFLVAIGRNMIVPIAPLFIVSLLPPQLANESIYAGLVISVSSATATFSGVYLGRLGDKIGHRKILIGTAIAAVVFYLPQPFVTNVWQLLILQGLTGLAIGGIIAAPSALLAQFTEPGEEGAVYGLDNAIVAGGRAVAPLLGSAVAIALGFRGTFAATAVVFAVIWLVSSHYLPKPKYVQLQPIAAGD